MAAERKWRILYVEDQPEMIDLIELAFRQRPVEIVRATSAPQAIELLHRSPPDLVFLDLMMPEVDGWRVHQEIVENPMLRHIPIIVITARGNPEEREKGLRMQGIVDYFIKPFSPSALLASVDRVLAGLSAQRGMVSLTSDSDQEENDAA
ncbi:MAG: response regulator [Anaerolineae bacterium]|nr:response regulator [Anaerolineae bacterium]MDW8100442.1 response regulator [Anaerolineae bacterium]